MELSRLTESPRTILTILLVLLVAAPLSASPLQSPMEAIRWSNQEILAIYESSAVIDQGAMDRVHEIMDQVTSFESLAGDAIDVFCDRFEESQCQAFKDAFVELLSISSVSRLGRYRADRFEYLGESVEGDTALVQTLAFYEDDGVEIDYRLALIDGQWLIVNYLVDGVDTVMNWRRQFRRLLRSDSVEDVIRRLERKTEEYEREARSRGEQIEDHTADLGVPKTLAGNESLYARTRLVNAATTAGVQAIDSVFGDIEKMEGLAEWGVASRGLGFAGMGCIHPRQIPTVVNGKGQEPVIDTVWQVPE